MATLETRREAGWGETKEEEVRVEVIQFKKRRHFIYPRKVSSVQKVFLSTPVPSS
jgi:hypothetical protein